MEDRKRAAGDDLAPPTKRQAVNGKASADADMPWAGDLEVCSYRQSLDISLVLSTSIHVLFLHQCHMYLRHRMGLFPFCVLLV